MFVGPPDDVHEQLARFVDGVGGLGNFLMMGHAGHMTHADAMDQITLMAKEVLPRLGKQAATAAA
jgi:alkanesulfonate monooxygenase SsuD/methylene tetrahydromethanopterin reductase-like flavin-dependent oxidoreductase (luciferase family)